MRRTAVATLNLAVAAVGITGCLPGGGKTDARPKGPFAGLSGGQVLDRAATATTDAPSLRMSGQMPDETTGGAARFDMVLSGKGECSGTISYAQGKADVIRARRDHNHRVSRARSPSGSAWLPSCSTCRPR